MINCTKKSDNFKGNFRVVELQGKEIDKHNMLILFHFIIT